MQKLSNKTAQLLSSGQVISSICNAVKELVENSFDAKATNLEVKLEKGGLGKIEVRDNGIGITTADMNVAAQKHYTSKIESHSDLQTLITYGFRGEALSSLCEVSDVTVTTRTKNEPYSNIYVLDSDGKIKSKKPSHISQGTTVTALNLYKNFPVRKQFFSTAKKVKEQLKLTEDILMAYAIAQPFSQLKLISDRSIIWQKSPEDNEKNAFLRILGLSNIQLHSIESNCNNDNINLKIYFPTKYIRRKTKDRFFLIINKRPVHNKQIEKLTRSFILKITNNENVQNGGWPAVLLLIDVSPSAIDVNVNPNKTEIFLTQNQVILNLLEDMFDSYSLQYCSDPSLAAEKSTQKQMSNINQNSLSDAGTPFANDNAIMLEEPHLDEATINHSSKTFGVSKSTSLPVKETNLKEISKTCDKLPSTNEKENCHPTICTPFANDNAIMLEEPHLDKVAINHSCNTAGVSKSTSLPVEEINSKEISEACDKLSTTSEEENCDPTNTLNNLKNKNFLESNIEIFSKSSTELSNTNKVGSMNWSLGKAMVNSNGSSIQPVRIAHSLATTTKRPSDENLRQSTLDKLVSAPAPKRPRTIDEFCLDSTDKQWDDLDNNEQIEIIEKACSEYDTFSKQQTEINKKRARKSFLKLSPVTTSDDENYEEPEKLGHSIDFGKLSERITALNLTTVHKKVNSPNVVGFVNDKKGAILKYCSEYFVVNLYRLQEALIFKKLSQNMKLPCVDLEKTILIDKSTINSELFNCLLTMAQSATTQLQPDAEIIDKRITYNGFKIRKLQKSLTEFHIHALANFVSSFGIDELSEVLLKINKNKSTTIEESRPAKCTYYIQGEASRMARSSPLLSCKIEILDALLFLRNENQTWINFLSEYCCYHSQNVFQILKKS